MLPKFPWASAAAGRQGPAWEAGAMKKDWKEERRRGAERAPRRWIDAFRFSGA
jgi:hypothetical protein